MGRINRAHARCCEEADLASLGWICVAEQRCTDAAPVLDAGYMVDDECKVQIDEAAF